MVSGMPTSRAGLPGGWEFCRHRVRRIFDILDIHHIRPWRVIFMSTTTIGKWGNSLALRLPAEAVTNAQINAGDAVKIISLENGDILVRRVRGKVDLHAMLDAITADNLPEVHDERPVGKEVW